METELKAIYNKLWGRSNDNNSGSDSSGSEDSGSKDLEAYDGFADGFQLSQAINQNPSLILVCKYIVQLYYY